MNGIYIFIFRSELKLVYKKALILAGYASAYSCYPIVSTVISLFPFIMAGNHLTPQNVFTTMAFLGTLHKPVTIKFPYELRALFQAITTLERIQLFLLGDNTNSLTGANDPLRSKLQSGDPSSYDVRLRNEVQSDKRQFQLANHVCNQGRPFICLNHVRFRPGDDSGVINCCISNSRLIGITGPVGCGKSSLFHSIIGEIPLDLGQIVHQGRIAYVSQTPWLFSGTIRENILFGKEYISKAFQRAIEVCSMKEDLASLPRGDLTHIGERGVSLSGGQRARVNLARAVYSDADIYLLDDPLSSVDVKVSNEIFEKCIGEALSDRIRLLITHQPNYLKIADTVFLIGKDGSLSQGTFKELCESGQFYEISALISSGKGRKETILHPLANHEKVSANDIDKSSGLEMEDEDRMTGSVSYLTYWNYITFGFSKICMIFMGILFFLPEGKCSSVAFCKDLIEMSLIYGACFWLISCFENIQTVHFYGQKCPKATKSGI